jgi:hypothetical protein
MEEIELLISEVVQMREQYVDEVGGGRRKWPRSIKERVLKLVDLGLRLRQISEQTGVPYETVCQWKYQRGQKSEAFHQLPVVATRPRAATITNAGTVTAPANEIMNSEKPISIRTPDGYWIKTWSPESAALVLRLLRGGG